MGVREFLADHAVFTFEEFARALPGSDRANLWSLLKYHTKQGHIGRIKRGLYFVVPPGRDAESYPVDAFLVAGKAADDAVLAYHTALSFHGVAYSVRYEFTYLTEHPGSRSFEFRGTTYKPVDYPKALIKSGHMSLLVNEADRRGVKIRVTALERALVDALDRVDLGGGIEEVWRSLESIGYLKINQVAEYALLLNNATSIAKVGWFLDRYRDKLHVTDDHLAGLRKARPAQLHYMFRQDRRGVVVPEWNLVVPAAVLERSWEEPEW
jgi:predicted transcriptional regulator of viral defense system